MKDIKTPLPDILPLVPLKNTVVFPQSLLSIYVSQEKSKKALLSAWKDKRMIFTSALENPEGSANKVYQTGCVSLIMRVKEMADGRIKALIQGLSRAHLKEVQEKEFLQAHIQPHDEQDTYNLSEQERQYFLEVKNLLSKLAQTEEGFSPDFFLIIEGIKNPGLVCDLIVSNLTLKLSDSQQALETFNIKERLILTRNLVQGELLQGRIQKLIKNRISKQKTTTTPPAQAFQYAGINSSKKEEIAEYAARIEEQNLPQPVKKEVRKQLSRLEKMHTESSEASMIRTYLDCVLELPWNNSSEDNLDLKNAEGILNKDHYELKKVKERVLEFLAVQSLSPANLKGPILCFVGPPGVGKTSLGQSIAKAMGRKYARISLGGVKDEAEIRGHRRTYVGAMPGKIMQALNTCGTNNPVIVLDEVDKLGADFRGDPASALLEVLDPEQNHSFKDHYLNLNFNLSKVLFIATANLEQNIPYALRDRLEVVSISGYTQTEKIQIAKDYLIEKELAGHGLPEKHLQFTTEGLKSLINFYTQEAGLRNLKREISAICRKMAKNFVLGDKKKHTVNKQKIFEILGTPHYFPEEHLKEAKVGIATGLAWTSAGGQILHVEAITVKNKKGGLRLTGKLGEVMKESGQAALSYVKACCESLNIDPVWFEENEIHIHLPGGAIPKDGPSAGVTLATVIMSLITKEPVKNTVAMTGEITLSGRVLPVGGIREKVLAAFNYGINTVIIPSKNEKDLQDIPEEFKNQMNFALADNLHDVYKVALPRFENVEFVFSGKKEKELELLDDYKMSDSA